MTKPLCNRYYEWDWLLTFRRYHIITMILTLIWQGQIYRLLSCLHVRPVTSVCLNIGIPYLAHGCMCQVHSWSWYDINLWSQGQIYRVNDMVLCLGLRFFIFWHSHTLFGTWVYHHGMKCCIHEWTLYDLDIWPLSKSYFHHGLESSKISLLFDIGIPNFGIWVYHHETTCCVHFLPLYDLDLWPICGWRGYP